MKILIEPLGTILGVILVGGGIVSGTVWGFEHSAPYILAGLLIGSFAISPNLINFLKWLIDYESPEEIKEKERKTREESYARCLKNISSDGETVNAKKLSEMLVDGLWGDSKRYNK